MSCATNNSPICPCGTVVHPIVIFNPPGHNVIAYRAGDYGAFGHALLQALEGEHELTQLIDGRVRQIWRPSVTGDLALQMMEWWAYLADVLTFYNERAAAQAYLRTADLPESVSRLIQILGYRPRPALGATGILAALANSQKPFTLSSGFQIQSKPGPGKQPQVFELSAGTAVQPLSAISAQPTPASSPLLSTDQTYVWLKGKVSGIKVNDRLLLLSNSVLRGGQITGSDYAWLTVQSVQPQTDPNGNAITQILFTQPVSQVSSAAQAADYQIMRSTQSAVPWPYYINPPVIIIGTTITTIELASIARGIGVGDPVLLEVTGSSDAQVTTTLVTVSAYSEAVWYANGAGPTPPTELSPPSTPAVPIPHTHLEFNQLLEGDWNSNASHVTVRYGWAAAGQLVPILSPQDNVLNSATGSLTASPTTPFPPGTAMPVLLEDKNGDGSEAAATVDASAPTTMTLSNVSPLPQQGLQGPLKVLFNLLPVSRGKTVANEVLGSGNAAILGQDFTLQNAPVTYLQDPASRSGDNYSSTVRVWVNGIEWQEVRSFYGQPANAQVFMTREDEQGRTHVVFGSRLPTGVNNVVASYRYGAGADAPSPGTLTVVLQPQPGLASIHNPVAPTGGADADPPDKVRKLAPRSVMTFNRAVSLDDYEVIAASAPGVRRAKAAFSFDAAAQRPSVNIWVGDDAGAVAATQAALAATADPNRPVVVTKALQIETFVTLTYLRDPKYVDATVKGSLQAELLDPDKGLFGINAVGIGQAFYDSQIYAACLAVPGVKAVNNLQFSPVIGEAQQQTFARRVIAAPVQLSSRAVTPASLPPLSPAAFAFRPLRMRGTALPLCRGHRYDPGPSGYFFIPDDGKHLTLLPSVAA
jgi:predicted phage baseplate assembly protein